MAGPSSKSIAVIGAGLTGLTAAWRLHRAGHRVTVFEKNQSAGGVISTTRQNGWLIEAGPNSLQQTTEVATLLRELGLEGQQVVANAAARKRFIVRKLTWLFFMRKS